MRNSLNKPMFNKLNISSTPEVKKKQQMYTYKGLKDVKRSRKLNFELQSSNEKRSRTQHKFFM